MLLTVTVALAVGMGGMGVAAQETPTNETENETQPLDDDLGDEAEQVIDTETRVMDWSYDSGVFTITLDADAPTKVAVTEAGGFQEGSGAFNYNRFEIPEGESVVTFATRDAQQRGTAVTISTQQSLAQGGGAYLSTGGQAQDPFEAFGGTSGLFTGVTMSVVLAALSAAYVLRQEANGVVEAGV
ncbi:hypothetical protein [Natronoarchaeum sp. GCM10025703]|uniref:hypothetical protein n=1 Tax=Natronoarchaeum sp. GCM10025703 TaxID=3252685 RepID=UPI00366C3643